MHARVPDDAGWYGSSLYRIRPCCLLLPRRHRHPGLNCFRRSQPGLHTPLSTLRVTPRGATRMTRGRCGSLPLHRSGLSPPTSCRSPGAPWLNPPPHPITVYASHPPSPTTAQHSLPGGALPPYRGRSFTGRIASASPDAPEPEVRIHLPPAESPMRTSLASSSVSPSSTTTLSTSRSSTERAQISQMIERQAARECCTDRLARLASTTAWRPYPSIRLPRARATQSAAVPTSDRTGNDSRACRDRARRSR